MKSRVTIVGKLLQQARIDAGLDQGQLAAQYRHHRAAHAQEFPDARATLGNTDISKAETAEFGTQPTRFKKQTAEILATILNVPVESFTRPREPDTTQDEDIDRDDKEAILPDEQIEKNDKNKNSQLHLVGLQAEQESILLPYISVPARASFISMGGTLSSFPPNETRRVYLRGKPKEMYKERVVFEVDGDSMDPRINSGDEVIAVEVPEGRWDMQQNCVLVVSYSIDGEGVVTIKKVVNNDLMNKGTLTLRPWKDELAPFTVKRVDIRSMFLVELVQPRPYKPTL